MAEALSLKDFKKNVDRMLHDLPGAMLRLNQEIGVDIIPKITSRLTDRGITSEGRSLGTYSTKPMSPLFFLGHGLKAADAKIKAKIKRQQKAGEKPGVSYEEWRRFNNLPTNHVTLSFSSETLKDIAVLRNESSEGGVITTIGSKDSKSKDIFNAKGKKTGTISTGQVLDQLNEKYGRALDTDLLEMSKEEEERSAKIQDDKLQQFLDKFF